MDTTENNTPSEELQKSTAVTEGTTKSTYEILAQETSSAWKEELVESVTSDDQDEESTQRKLKIYCHKCQQKLDVTCLRPFSIIECPNCGEKLVVPKWFDTYLLEEPCGFGGLATVYRALDIPLDREVAIKILKPEFAKSKEQSELFLNEARMVAAINDTSVIPIYTCGYFEDQTYLVMQYMSGGTLEQKLQKEKGHSLPIEQVLQWIRDVAEGLDSAARHGIIHHDIKPGNILLDADGNAKIGDFGLAQNMQNPTSPENNEEDTWVTPYYVSPEKIMTGTEDGRGDIYSLGATFYHLLTGKVPFENENLEEMIWARTRQNPPPPNTIRPEIPQLISVLIMKMMSIQPDARPTYREILTPLDSVLNNEDTAPLILMKNYPMPKTAGEADDRNPSKVSLRVKSPSAILKSRRSSIHQTQNLKVIEGQAQNAQPRDPNKPKTKKQKPRTRYLLLLLIFSGVIMLCVLVFSVMQLLQAFFLPEAKLPAVQSENIKK